MVGSDVCPIGIVHFMETHGWLLMEDTVDYQLVSPDGELTISIQQGGFNSSG